MNAPVSIGSESESTQLPSIDLNSYTFTIRPDCNLSLSVLSRRFRGSFGYYLRRTFCVSPGSRSCGECRLAQECVYGYLFESVAPPGRRIMRLYSTVPHPFTYEIDLGTDTGTMDIRLVLVGASVQFFPHVFLALQRMGTEGLGKDIGGFGIERVSDCTGAAVYRKENERLEHNPVTMSVPAYTQRGAKGFKIDLTTPLRLQRDGRVLTQIDFPAFATSVARRATLLSYFYCRREITSDNRTLKRSVAAATVVSDDTRYVHISRHSRRQARRYDNGGLLGSFEVMGKFPAELVAFLNLGTYIHAGKATSFGYGRYRLSLR